jgi:hypothetical protein
LIAKTYISFIFRFASLWFSAVLIISFWKVNIYIYQYWKEFSPLDNRDLINSLSSILYLWISTFPEGLTFTLLLLLFPHLFAQVELVLMLWVRIAIRARCTTLCDKVSQWLATGRWFSPGPPVSTPHLFAQVELVIGCNINSNNNEYSFKIK